MSPGTGDTSCEKTIWLAGMSVADHSGRLRFSPSQRTMTAWMVSEVFCGCAETDGVGCEVVESAIKFSLLFPLDREFHL